LQIEHFAFDQLTYLFNKEITYKLEDSMTNMKLNLIIIYDSFNKHVLCGRSCFDIAHHFIIICIKSSYMLPNFINVIEK
jgi:hypothetical protein